MISLFGERAQRRTFQSGETNFSFFSVLSRIQSQMYSKTLLPYFVPHVCCAAPVAASSRQCSAAAPCSGAPWCQFNQPGTVILWHLHKHKHMHMRAGTQRCRRQGTAELMTHLSAPPPPSSSSSFPSLSVPLSFPVCAGDITQKGYEKKRSKLLAPFIPQIQGKTPRALQDVSCLQQTAVLRLAVGRRLSELSWLE